MLNLTHKAAAMDSLLTHLFWRFEFFMLLYIAYYGMQGNFDIKRKKYACYGGNWQESDKNVKAKDVNSYSPM